MKKTFSTAKNTVNYKITKTCLGVSFRDTASGWAGWALAHPEFGSSANPIPTRGADYAHHITACPPAFENLTVSMSLDQVKSQNLYKIKCKNPQSMYVLII